MTVLYGEISLFMTDVKLRCSDWTIVIFLFHSNPRCSMVRSMVCHRDFTIVPLRFHHRPIVPSCFHHRTIAFSPSCHRAFTIVPSRFYHRVILFSLLYHCVFTIVQSRFHNRTIALSPSYHRVFTIVPSRHRTSPFSQYDKYTNRKMSDSYGVP
jgi:hypothetical protein